MSTDVTNAVVTTDIVMVFCGHCATKHEKVMVASCAIETEYAIVGEQDLHLLTPMPRKGDDLPPFEVPPSGERYVHEFEYAA